MKVRHRYVLLFVVAWAPPLATAAAFYLLVIGPETRYARQLETELTKTTSRCSMAQEAARKDNQARLTQTVESLENRAGDFIVTLQDAPDLAFAIAGMASDAGVESFAMKPRGRQVLDPASTGDRVAEKYIDVSFGSSFHRFMTLLNALERHHPALFVETFSISHLQTPALQPQVNMALAVLIERLQGSGSY